MIAGAIGVFVAVVSIAIALWTTHYLRRERTALPPRLAEQRSDIRSALDKLIDQVPTSAALLDDQFPVHSQTDAVVAKLLGDNPRGALAEAERVLADLGADPRAHLLVARACLAANELDAAKQQVARAKDLGDRSPMLRFIEARLLVLSHLRGVHQDNAEIGESPIPNMITPIELLLLSFEKQRSLGGAGSGVWLPEHGQISDEEIAAMVATHFAIYYESIEGLIAAATEVRGFSDALYHVARMALKIGFAERGRALFGAIEPLMESSPDRREYRRDVAQLHGDQSSVVSPLPKLTGTAKRSGKLRVL